MENPVTLDEQIASVERELRLRQRVYPRWVEQGKLNQGAADHEFRCMSAVAETLRGIKESER